MGRNAGAAVDAVTRIVEDLDALRERATITKDAVQQHMSDAMTKSMNCLSAVAFVFLPLGFISGLFGINVPASLRKLSPKYG